MKKNTKYPLIVAVQLLMLSVVATSNSYADYPIAGEDPSARPAGAPTVGNIAKGNQWYQQALSGVVQPYPASLKFLENQGNWNTPFNNPGMTGPYDIRAWHQGGRK